MTYNPQSWHRYEFNQLPIYVRSDRPTWFVPNRSGEELLQSGDKGGNQPLLEKFLARLPDAPAVVYPGRYQYLNTDRLNELWFHITNRCNLSCQHCLFTSGPTSTEEMSAELILSRAQCTCWALFWI